MRIFTIVILALTVAASSTAQTIPSALSGTWEIQADANAARNRRPLTGLSIATRLTIRQSPAEVIVESNTGTEGATVATTYKLDGSEQAIPGPIGWDTRAKSTWDGKALVANIRRAVQGPEGELVFEIRETYTVAADTLILERVQGKTTQKLVYSRK